MHAYTYTVLHISSYKENWILEIETILFMENGKLQKQFATIENHIFCNEFFLPLIISFFFIIDALKFKRFENDNNITV